METIILQQTDPAILDVATLALEENYNVISLREIPSKITLLISTYRPHLFILDYILDGKQATCDLNKIRAFCNIQVVAMSCNQNIDKESALHGFDGYIKKPFDIDRLLKLVGYYICFNIKKSPVGFT